MRATTLPPSAQQKEHAHEKCSFPCAQLALARSPRVGGGAGCFFPEKRQLRAPRRRLAHDESWRAASRRMSAARMLRVCAKIIIPGGALERARDFFIMHPTRHCDRAARHASTGSATNITPMGVKLGIRTVGRIVVRAASAWRAGDAWAANTGRSTWCADGDMLPL